MPRQEPLRVLASLTPGEPPAALGGSCPARQGRCGRNTLTACKCSRLASPPLGVFAAVAKSGDGFRTCPKRDAAGGDRPAVRGSSQRGCKSPALPSACASATRRERGGSEPT